MFTLYIATDRRNPRRYDLGSVLCLKTIQNVPRDQVLTVDCDAIQSRPMFLKGTPTLVDESTHEIYTGHNALDRLQILSLYHAEQFGASQTRPDQSNSRATPNTVRRAQERVQEREQQR